MNKNVDKLLGALKSDEYGQIFYSLKGTRSLEGSYCVMGLACEVYRLDHLCSSRWEERSFVILDDSFAVVDTGEQTAPSDVLAWYGMSLEDASRLTELNDEFGYNFLDLADWIETPKDERVMPEDLYPDECDGDYGNINR